mgnify:CR=1 FL=1
MSDITIEKIKQDLETAAYVDRLLPAVRAPKYRCCMPDIIYTPQEIVFMDKRPLKVRPNQEQISLWEQVMLEWLPILSVDERRLVWKEPTVFRGSCCAGSLAFHGRYWPCAMKKPLLKFNMDA